MIHYDRKDMQILENNLYTTAGIYIMQNTMVRGEGVWWGNVQPGKKMKLGVRKITLKKGEKALKIHIFGL